MHCFRGVVLALALLGAVCCHAGVSANEGGTDPSFELTAEGGGEPTVARQARLGPVLPNCDDSVSKNEFRAAGWDTQALPLLQAQLPEGNMTPNIVIFFVDDMGVQTFWTAFPEENTR